MKNDPIKKIFDKKTPSYMKELMIDDVMRKSHEGKCIMRMKCESDFYKVGDIVYISYREELTAFHVNVGLRVGIGFTPISYKIFSSSKEVNDYVESILKNSDSRYTSEHTEENGESIICNVSEKLWDLMKIE